MSCETMGIHEDRALWMIEHYAGRNEHTFHANTEDNQAFQKIIGLRACDSGEVNKPWSEFVNGTRPEDVDQNGAIPGAQHIEK